MLGDFFDDPNNIDPSFLALTQGGQEHDPFGDPSQQWLFGGLQQEQDAHLRQAHHQTTSVGTYSTQQVATDDVYTAAKLLHSHQSAYQQNGTFTSSGFGNNPNVPQAQMFDFTPDQTARNVYHQGSTSEQVSTLSASDYNAIMQNQSTAHRPAPLNFGSDSKFHNTKYVAPSIHKPPDQDLMNLLSSFSHEPEEHANHPRQASPGTLKRKRRQSTLEERGLGSSDDEQEFASKRSKVQTKADESEDEAGSLRGKTSRRSSGKAPKVLSPAQRRKTSPSGRKPARENLTDEQKRNNHIQSEQKRRNLIKIGFEETNRMVPELRAGGFSKSNMLQEAARFMRELKDGNDRLSAIVGLLDNG